jgi:integrase
MFSRVIAAQGMFRAHAAWLLAPRLVGMVGPWIVDRAVDKVRQVDELHFHSLRHHVATLLIDSGCDVKTVQARMRHSSAKTTLDVYGHRWKDTDETTRTAIGGVIAARAASSSDVPAGALRAERRV